MCVYVSRSSNTCLATILKRLAQVLANMLCCAKWLLFAFAPTYMLSSIHHIAPWNYFGDNTRQAGTTHGIYSAQYTNACYLPIQVNTGDLCNVTLAQPPTQIQNTSLYAQLHIIDNFCFKHGGILQIWIKTRVCFCTNLIIHDAVHQSGNFKPFSWSLGLLVNIHLHEYGTHVFRAR